MYPLKNAYIEPFIHFFPPKLDNLISWLKILDFSYGIIESTDDLSIGEDFNPHLFLRKTLMEQKKNPNNLTTQRFQNDLIIFHCQSPEMVKWACQDQRIDGLQFPIHKFHQLVDESTVNLLESNDKLIEICLPDILKKRNPIAPLRNIIKVIHKAQRKQVPIIISSQAKSLFELNHILCLLGFSEFIGMTSKYFTEGQWWLLTRVLRNRKRREGQFIAPGVWKVDNDEEKE